jgi:hypothetical protein
MKMNQTHTTPTTTLVNRAPSAAPSLNSSRNRSQLVTFGWTPLAGRVVRR